MVRSVEVTSPGNETGLRGEGTGASGHGGEPQRRPDRGNAMSFTRNAALPHRKHLSAVALAAAATLLAAPAFAGGYDTGQRDWDFLFQESPVAVEAEAVYINPLRRLDDVRMTAFPGTSAHVDEADAVALGRGSLAVRLGGAVRCLGSYREPFAGFADYGSDWVGAPSAITQDFSSRDLGVTCAVSVPAGPGDLSFLGGASYQEVEYELTQAAGIAGIRTTRVSDDGTGWRAGVAYEIPEYALRASLIYNAAIAYDMTGTVDVSAFPLSTPVFGAITMPQSVELKMQSGVAPGWLAFGAVRWTDWSVAENMPLCAVGTPVCTQAAAVSGLTLLWKDTWTVTFGAAHQFSKAFSLAANLTYDQGASQGFTSQTDIWTTGLTAVFAPNQHKEFKLGGTVGVMPGGKL